MIRDPALAARALSVAGDDLVPAYQCDGTVCMRSLPTADGVARRRRVFSVRFLGDDMRHAPRRWRTSPEFPGLADALPAGAPMRHALFPLLIAGDA